MLDIAIGNLLQKKLRSALTLLGIMACANLYIIVTSVANYMTDDLDQQMENFAGQVIVQTRSEFGQRGLEWPPLSSSINQSDSRRILARPGLVAEQSSDMLFVAQAPPPYVGGPPEILAVGVQPGREASLLRHARVREGSFSLEGGARNPVILGAFAGRALADSASATTKLPTPAGDFRVPAVGSTISVKGESFTVVGLISGHGNQLFRSLLVMPLETAQLLFNRPDSVSGVIVTPSDVSRVPEVARAIEAEFPLLSAVSQTGLEEAATAAVAQVKRFMDVLRVTALLAAAVIVTIVMLVAVLERTRELGTLRAIGAPAWSILAIIVMESAILMLLGALAAIPVSVAALNTSIQDGSALNDREIWAISTLLITAVGVLGGLLPAVRAASVDPVVALRYE